jgi:hypothetical protein
MRNFAKTKKAKNKSSKRDVHCPKLNRFFFVVEKGDLHGLCQDVRVTVGNPFKSVLVLIQFHDKNGRIGFRQNARALNGFSPPAVRPENQSFAEIRIQIFLDFG